MYNVYVLVRTKSSAHGYTCTCTYFKYYYDYHYYHRAIYYFLVYAVHENVHMNTSTQKTDNVITIVTCSKATRKKQCEKQECFDWSCLYSVLLSIVGLQNHDLRTYACTCTCVSISTWLNTMLQNERIGIPTCAFLKRWLELLFLNGRAA